MEKDHCSAGLQFNLIRFYKKECMLVFVCTETTESKPVKKETSCTSPYGECSLDRCTEKKNSLTELIGQFSATM